MFFWSHPRCFGPLGKFQHNIKISIETACVSRLSVSYDYGFTYQTFCLTRQKFLTSVRYFDSCVTTTYSQSRLVEVLEHPHYIFHKKITIFYFSKICNIQRYLLCILFDIGYVIKSSFEDLNLKLRTFKIYQEYP